MSSNVDIGEKSVVVAGAGLAGGLLACYLRKRGLNVHVVERRPDPRSNVVDGGRSINLALSERGINALKGIGLLDEILAITIPMYGRQIHAVDGSTMFQPYSTDGKECIRSVSRLELNKRLIDCAERAGAKLHFDKQITRFSPRSGELFFTDDTKCAPLTVVATDGAYSPVRRSIMNAPFFDYNQKYHAHGYKELCIPPVEGTTKHRLELNALHIWPRGTYMMIALPNTDGSFTCTLFMPLKGEISLESLNTDEKVLAFFNEKFADAVPLMPTLLQDFKNNPNASLMTISCFPWSVDGRLALLGDACHALVPFFGQGMNCAFEDVFVMDKCIDELTSGAPAQEVPWERVYKKYEVLRKPNADAILELALENYIEMRDKVADKVFQFRSKVAAKVGKAFPNQFKTRYELVSFSNIPYTDCIKRGLVNDSIIDELVKNISDFDPEKVDMNLAKTLVDKHFPLQH